MEKVEWLMQSQPKFREYPTNYTLKQWVEIELLLLACSLQLGITNAPEPEILQKMCKSLKEQSPDLNASELNEAFDLYAFQKLDFKTSHYNSFDVLFLGNVVTSYKRYRAQELAKLKSQAKKIIEEPKEVLKVNTPESTNKILAYFEESLFPQFDKYCKSHIYRWTELEEKLIYTHLEEIGIFNMSIQEKKDFASDMTKQLRLEIKDLVKRKLAKFDINTDDFSIEPFYLKKRCQSEMVKRWIQEMDMTETNIRELITTKISELK